MSAKAEAAGVKIRAVYFRSPAAQGNAVFPQPVEPKEIAKSLKQLFTEDSEGTLRNLRDDISKILPNGEALDIKRNNVGQVLKFIKASSANRNAALQIINQIRYSKDATSSLSDRVIYGLQIQGGASAISNFVHSVPASGLEYNTEVLYSSIKPKMPDTLQIAVDRYSQESSKLMSISDIDLAKLLVNESVLDGLMVKGSASSDGKISSQAVTTDAGSFYPNRGTMYYTPRVAKTDDDQVRFTMAWDDPGRWWIGPARDGKTHRGVFELDFNEYNSAILNGGSKYAFAPGCTSRTDLPSAYDDCPTSAVSDNNYTSHGLGSWDASSIQPHRIYNTVIFLRRVDRFTTMPYYNDITMGVTAATLQHDLCVPKVSLSGLIVNPSVPDSNEPKYKTCETSWPQHRPVPGWFQGCSFYSNEYNIWCMIGARGTALIKDGMLDVNQKATFDINYSILP